VQVIVWTKNFFGSFLVCSKKDIKANPTNTQIALGLSVNSKESIRPLAFRFVFSILVQVLLYSFLSILPSPSCLRNFETVFLAYEKASLFISLLAQRNEPKKRPIFQGVRDEAKACLYRSLQPESVTFETDLFRLSVIYTAKNAFRKYPFYQARLA
jgi:hypothetical protein